MCAASIALAISMDTNCIRIALGTILLILPCLPFLSIAEVIYPPLELFSISCGSSTNFTLDGRNWIGDNNSKLLSESQGSVAAPPNTPTAIQGPYTYARLSHSQFTYSFSLKAGPKFVRLFFYSASYQSFYRTKAYFSVTAGPYTLLRDFDASLNAAADDDPGQPDILFREYCINLEDGQKQLNITFIPSKTAQHPYSYAFINGIEIVSMPPFLYYTNPDDYDGVPQTVGTLSQYHIENSSALETIYRLNVAGKDITGSEDTGMLRTWKADDNYLTTQSTTSVDFGRITKLSFNMTQNYTAPDEVYRTVRNMGTNGSMNMRFNLTWQLPVDSGFTYLLRLHFCELDPFVLQAGDLMFVIYIADQLVTNRADVLLWTDNQKGVPVVRDYVVLIPGNRKKLNLSLKIHPHPLRRFEDAQLNALELFKINDSTGNLAGPNPDPPLQTPKAPVENSKKKSSDTTRTLAAVAGAVSGVVLVSLIVAFFLIKRKKNVAIDKCSNQKDGSSHGDGSSSLPTNLCRHFSIEEIRAATNNFDELFIVGTGGFGNVYKGYIEDSSTPVAIKRLKPGSRQGVDEFVTEIEMLSQLRHLNLVSLLGYCYESNEMILVYEFMDHGALRDHLYDTDNPSLSWKQRLHICIGVARGLNYLHTGVKHMIIHRDVKSTNILLDAKWAAKVSDFGLSRIGPTGISMTHVNTGVKGSIGYLDPEYYKRLRLTEKSDVYSFGVVLLEVLSGRQPLLHWEEKQRISLVKWAKHCCEKGTLSKIMDAELKGQIAPVCLRKFGDVALSCLFEDGTQRPSMKDVVGMLELVLQLQDSAANDGVMESGRDYEDSEDVFGSSHSSVHVSDYSKSTGLSTTSEGDRSYGSKESFVLISNDVFSEIKDPKGR
ncbi:hypothetical protein GLYMA_18G271100v4 [Glycine max]|uniref:Protein kinase domain-containing protein n=1 Tax=Glycine max TaxID=3847 RepID=I1N4N7_SOYBN|nr:receptor-like protein kinase FERONIA-like [Glycine max]KAH1156363.1 hypothetical protein GYH30_051253 [Glycine max]KRH01348.1 hypothetical protein GLYMA_18G271100v4 [Glycine max]